eukprot:m.41294 g.41294  ORF g.41294 m.41294 type:complete len:363 (+) comp11446_c1_seq1:797-1885(+)
MSNAAAATTAMETSPDVRLVSHIVPFLYGQESGDDAADHASSPAASTGPVLDRGRELTDRGLPQMCGDAYEISLIEAMQKAGNSVGPHQEQHQQQGGIDHHPSQAAAHPPRRLSVPWLADCRSQFLTQVPPVVLGSKSVTHLRLGFNNLTSLPDALCGMEQLESLELHYNQLTQLPDGIGRLRNLFMLKLMSNRLTSLPPSVDQLTSLRQLCLAYNPLSDHSFLSRLPQLEALSLGGNEYTAMPSQLLGLTNLTFLDLSNNNLESLPDAMFTELTELRGLDLDSNKFATLAPGFDKLTKLTHLSVQHNQLTMLPAQLGRATALKKVYTDGNPLVAAPVEYSTTQDQEQRAALWPAFFAPPPK